MLRSFLAASFLLIASGQAQQVQWSHININIQHLDPTLDPARLDAATKASIGLALQRNEQRQHDERATFDTELELCLCNARQWRQQLRFFRAPLGRPGIVLVSPPISGGTPNESRWLVELHGTSVHILASLHQGFTGWGLGIQSSTSHGLHDFVVGWHISAAETTLSYFRYDGNIYRRIASEDLTPCVSGGGRVCFSDGTPAFDTF